MIKLILPIHVQALVNLECADGAPLCHMLLSAQDHKQFLLGLAGITKIYMHPVYGEIPWAKVPDKYKQPDGMPLHSFEGRDISQPQPGRPFDPQWVDCLVPLTVVSAENGETANGRNFSIWVVTDITTRQLRNVIQDSFPIWVGSEQDPQTDIERLAKRWRRRLQPLDLSFRTS